MPRNKNEILSIRTMAAIKDLLRKNNKHNKRWVYGASPASFVLANGQENGN